MKAKRKFPASENHEALKKRLMSKPGVRAAYEAEKALEKKATKSSSKKAA